MVRRLNIRATPSGDHTARTQSAARASRVGSRRGGRMSRSAILWGFGAAGVAFLIGRRRATDTSDDSEALARVITSEADGYSERERIAVAWAVRNRARKRGVS